MARAVILQYRFVKGMATPPPDTILRCKKIWTQQEWQKFVTQTASRNNAFVHTLRTSGLWDEMEALERSFILAGPDDVSQQDLLDSSWLSESIVCLLWALGYLSEIPPYDQQADPELTKKIPKEPIEVLLRNATLRSSQLIEKQRELAELWHWRSRTRQLQESGQDIALPNNYKIEDVIRIASSHAVADGINRSPIESDFPALGKPYHKLSDEDFSQVTSIAVERHRAFNWLCGFAPKNCWTDTPTDT